MTRSEILNMPEGEEIDALVAEKVMGWHLVKKETGRDEWHDAEGRYQHMVSRYDGYEDDEDFHTICWHPSESILWAWDVVDHFLSASRKRPKIDRVAEGDWRVQIDDWKEDTAAWSSSAPLAICRSALLAVMEAQ